MVVFLLIVLLLFTVFWLSMSRPWLNFICRLNLAMPELVGQKLALKTSASGVVSGLRYAVSSDGLRLFARTQNKPLTPRWRRKYAMAVVHLNERGTVKQIRWFSMTQAWFFVMLLIACFVPIETHERVAIFVIYFLFAVVLVFHELSALPKHLAEGLPGVMAAVSEQA